MSLSRNSLRRPASWAVVCHLLGSSACSRAGEAPNQVAAVLHESAVRPEAGRLPGASEPTPNQTAALAPPFPPEASPPEWLSEAGLYLPGTLELDPRVVE